MSISLVNLQDRVRTGDLSCIELGPLVENRLVAEGRFHPDDPPLRDLVNRLELTSFTEVSARQREIALQILDEAIGLLRERRRTRRVEDAQWRAQRIEWRFLRSGSEGRDTRLYANLHDAQRELLETLGGLGEDELAVIATIRDSETMSLVTTRRVLWATGGQKGQVSLAAITDATVLPGHFAAAGGEQGLESLDLVTENGVVSVAVEPGAPLVGVRNALRMVARWNLSSSGRVPS